MTQNLAPDDVQAIPVVDLFDRDAPKYSIPLYQRNYTWGEEQIHRLVHDVLDEAEQEVQKDYFLGNLVVAPPHHADDPFDVIDGQQRLTTLYLLLTKLSSRQHLRGRIGELQPLIYEARDKATRALRDVADTSRNQPEEESAREDSGILRAARIIDQLLDGDKTGARFLAPRVIEYLLTRVLLIRMPIDRTTDLNRYFEIMNTRGAQLSPVDIVKARLLRHLTDPLDRKLLNRVWTACADMEHYVGMTVTAGDAKLRAEIFGPDWDSVPSADFTRLRAQLIDGPSEDNTERDEEELPPTSSAMTLDEAVTTYGRDAVDTESVDADGGDRFNSQITFPTLLLHVLAVHGPTNDPKRDDRQLDDKLLVSRFAKRLEEQEPAERPAWVRTFTTGLLRIRYLFDQFVLKRDATLTSGHDSTTDDEPGSWSLYRLARGTSRQGRRVQDTPRYPPTFAADETGTGPKSLQRRILLLQSALRITYTSPRTMHWITDTLRYVTECTDRGQPVTARDFLDRLEAHTLERLHAALSPDPEKEEVGPDGLPLGFAIPRIIYTYLDYLLVEEMNQWDFTFSYRTSVEHFSPRTEDAEHISDAYRVKDRSLLNWLGNLALVTVSTNSKFSNYLPAQKANNHVARRQSLKLELMARRAETGSWNDEDVRAHHEVMLKLLIGALGTRSVGNVRGPASGKG